MVRWFLGRDGRGRRRYKSQTVHGTKKDAARVLRERLRERDLGTTIESSLTLNEYLDEWLEKAATGRLRPRTVSDYREKLDRYVRPILGGQRLDRLRPLDVQALVTELSERGAPGLPKPRRRPLAPQTVRYAHAVLSGALEQAVRWQMIRTNPARYVQLPKVVRKEKRSLSPEEAGRLRDAVRDTPFEALFLLLLGTGLRPGEAFALRWSDLDLEEGRVAVTRSLPRRKQTAPIEFYDPKTPRSRRSVPLPPTVIESLRCHRRRQSTSRPRSGRALSQRP